jgi:molybdate transport system substrate-binding protein
MNRRQSLALAATLPLAAWLAPWARSQAQAPATVAAASDLKFALEALVPTFEQETGHKLRLVFGSSGNFTTQILQGAPFHLFLSADESFVFRLADAGRTLDRGRVYAIGHIGLLVPMGSPLKPDPTLRDLGAAIRDGRLQKFAIANPDHAPYGMRAREALQAAGLWDAIQPHLVLGENISQAAQFVASGSVQGGLIALSLALAPPIARVGTFAQIPASQHQPLRQRMVLMKDAPPAARAFHDYLTTPPAQAVMRRFGFEMPRERD